MTGLSGPPGPWMPEGGHWADEGVYHATVSGYYNFNDVQCRGNH